jgi:hypothetical protein
MKPMVELAKLIWVTSQDQFELLEIYFCLPAQRLCKKKLSQRSNAKGDGHEKKHFPKKFNAFEPKTHEQAAANMGERD